MNRHTSNPFLSDWDEKYDTEPVTNIALFDTDVATITKNETESNQSSHSEDGVSKSTRRHSSQADVSGNPFNAQRATDRRLYHRNMSSFEAASLQLEHHQQQMQEYGSADIDKDKTDLIAKMTAEFQSAIETKDKEFNTEGVENNLNPFDPFETINDDDVSLPSSAQMQHEDRFTKFEDDTKTKGSDEATSFEPTPKITHDSIDDDEDELVSTPVRNIKSSSQKSTTNEQTLSPNEDAGIAITTSSSSMQKENAIVDDESCEAGQENVDSITKASLFASLLASAESGVQQPNLVINQNDESRFDSQDNLEQGEGTTKPMSVEQATHVITGSNRDGNTDRPVGFFDPFETVIDKDALTSLMNDNQYACTKQVAGNERSSSQVEDSNTEPKTVEPKGEIIDPSCVINEHQSMTTSDSQKISEQTSKYHNGADSAKPVTAGDRLAQKSTPKVVSQKKVPRTKRKPSFQEDSSDSSEDDDRIQIVIKARDFSHSSPSKQSGTTIVPLLPPPPSKSSMKQARERGQVEDMPSPVLSYKYRTNEQKSHSDQLDSLNANSSNEIGKGIKNSSEPPNKGESTFEGEIKTTSGQPVKNSRDKDDDDYEDEDEPDTGGQFVIPMIHSDDDGDNYGKPDSPLYDEDTSYVLEEFPAKYEGPGWDMLLRYPPKKKLTSNRFWKKIFVKLAEVPLAPPGSKTSKKQDESEPQTCIALQIFDKQDDKKPMQEIPIQATYTVSEISTQQFDQFGKIFTIKLQYIFYKERVGVRQGQLARFIHTGHIGSSTTSGGHGVDPISIGAIKRVGAPIEHSPQISQIIKLGCSDYEGIKQFKNCLEDYLFKIPIHRDRAISNYKTEEVQMAVRDETYFELNQVGTIIKQLARVRLFFLSFLNGTPTVEVGINDFHRQGREVVGRMDILPVVTEEWIRLEDWELHSTVDKEEFENPDSRIIKLVPPDATFFELMRFRVRPPRNRELPLQISANMSVSRTKVSIDCEVMVPGCVSRKHGQIPCENIAIKVVIPESWIYNFREEKHFRMGSKKSVNRRPGKVKGIERFLGGGGGLQDINDDSSLIEVTSGQAKYEHHHHAIVWRAARWPKESQSAYVQNTMKIRLPLKAYDEMPENLYEYVHVEYTMPATTVSHTTLRSISVNPCDDEPPEKYVKYSAKYEYRVKMRQSINVGSKSEVQSEASPIIIMKQPDLKGDLQREEDSDEDDDSSDEGQGVAHEPVGDH